MSRKKDLEGEGFEDDVEYQEVILKRARPRHKGKFTLERVSEHSRKGKNKVILGLLGLSLLVYSANKYISYDKNNQLKKWDRQAEEIIQHRINGRYDDADELYQSAINSINMFANEKYPTLPFTSNELAGARNKLNYSLSDQRATNFSNIKR